MKRRLWILVAIAAVLAAAGVGYSVLARSPEWTTDSPAALAEFEAATDARMKYYHGEAIAHLRKAVELDPDFVIAKLLLAGYLRSEMAEGKEEASALYEQVFAADLERLTPRERLMVERSRAIGEGDRERAGEILEAYLDEHPDDPYALDMRATVSWSEGDLQTAERLFRHILEVRPNWVGAYNMLGYVTMRQGRFVEAEEYLTSYRFIAPDQANPHDSLGELFTLLGRYDEAEDSLDRALEIKPDFYNSYHTLFLIARLREDHRGMHEVIRRAEAADVWSPKMLELFRCSTRLAELADARDWPAIIAQADAPCVTEVGPAEGTAVITHRAACLEGRWELADRIEERLREAIAKGKAVGKLDRESYRGTLAHMEAVRAAVEGRLDEAAELGRSADEALTYAGAGLGIFKLVNRLILFEILRADGHDVDAHRVLSQVRAVNPALVESFEERGLSLLGLSGD